MATPGALPGTSSQPSELEEQASLLEDGFTRTVEMAAKPAPKRTAVQQWLAVSPQGRASLLELAKLRVTQQLGVQLRDLRLVDPQLAASYPSAILARERALVLNLEFIKCIVTLDAVYLTSLDDPLTLRFVAALQRRLTSGGGAGGEGGVGEGGGTAAGAAQLPRASKTPGSKAAAGGASHAPATSFGTVDLPFELKVLEAALEAVTRSLEHQAEELESAAHPALDALTVKVPRGGACGGSWHAVSGSGFCPHPWARRPMLHGPCLCGPARCACVELSCVANLSRYPFCACPGQQCGAGARSPNQESHGTAQHPRRNGVLPEMMF
jgi:hypothetical protein